MQERKMYDIIAFARCDSDTTWSLHGLWPNYDNGSWPSYCFETDCDDIVAPIDPIYPPCWDTEETMCHEWLKHGTCYSKTPDVYFNNTFLLYNEYVNYVPDNITDLNYEIFLS